VDIAIPENGNHYQSCWSEIHLATKLFSSREKRKIATKLRDQDHHIGNLHVEIWGIPSLPSVSMAGPLQTSMNLI